MGEGRLLIKNTNRIYRIIPLRTCFFFFFGNYRLFKKEIEKVFQQIQFSFWKYISSVKIITDTIENIFIYLSICPSIFYVTLYERINTSGAYGRDLNDKPLFAVAFQLVQTVNRTWPRYFVTDVLRKSADDTCRDMLLKLGTRTSAKVEVLTECEKSLSLLPVIIHK